MNSLFWVVEVDGQTVAECSSYDEGVDVWGDILEHAEPGQIVALEEVQEDDNIWRCLECVRVEHLEEVCDYED